MAKCNVSRFIPGISPCQKNARWIITFDWLDPVTKKINSYSKRVCVDHRGHTQGFINYKEKKI